VIAVRWSGLARLLPRASARLRLTITFALLVTAVGAAIVTSIYLVMTYVPVYDITSSGTPATDLDPARRTDGPVSGSAAPSPGTALIGPAEAFEGGSLSGRITVNSSRDILGLLLLTSVIVFAAVLVAGVFVCWIVAGRVLRPVEQITEAARQAAAGSLDHRIDLAGPDDEFRQLASTFDDMLGRLDRSFQAQRRFAANASHELRTPLATTQAILDVALLDPETVEPETLTRKLRETNTRNIETVESLLALSDAQAGTIQRERIELDDIAREVVATTREDAAERGIVVHTAILASPLVGDPTLVRLLVRNLVGNAIRYNVVDGDVWLTVAEGRIRVENTGAVIAADDLPRLTEPFFRSAGRVAGSHGLGLALVDAIATSHGATLDLAARDDGGLVVEVRFPR
jgi:two-component system sensor histidine kinase VanS